MDGSPMDLRASPPSREIDCTGLDGSSKAQILMAGTLSAFVLWTLDEAVDIKSEQQKTI